MRQKLSRFGTALMLAVSLCIAPYSQTAYAFVQAAIPAGYALAAVLSVLGVSVAIGGDDDAAALWGDWELYTDDIDAMASQVSAMQDAAIASGNLSNVTKQQLAQDQMDSINAMFQAAGEAGSLALDNLSIMASDGVMGLLPFLLSLFISDKVSSSHISGSVVDPYGFAFNYAPLNSTMPSGSLQDVTPVFIYDGVTYVVNSKIGNSLLNTISFTVFDDFYPDKVGTLESVSYYCGSNGYSPYMWYSFCYDDAKGKWVYDKSLSLDPEMLLHGYGNAVFNSDLNFTLVSRSSLVSYATMTDGVWSGKITDNPDVIGGSDYWGDAKENKDILNPAAGAAVIGSDAVFDGDYIANRGSIAIPTDYTDINSWADALARAHAGIAQGAIDGTVSKSDTATATNTATGELATDTVGELVKPDSGSSVSPSKDFDWSKFLRPDLYLIFPFCLPFDLVELVKTLSAEPAAPVVDWPMPTLGGQEFLHVDLSPWDGVASVFRTAELFLAAIGLIWLTKTMIRV